MFKTLRTDPGQSVTELALVLPFILLFGMIAFEFGFALHAQVTLSNAAAEGARYAATAELPDGTSGGCDPDSIEDRTISFSSHLADCDAVTVVYQNLDGGVYERGDGVSVRIVHEYTPKTPLPALLALVTGGLFPASFDLDACADSRLEREPLDQALLAAGASCG